jgi:hypothetical protein
MFNIKLRSHLSRGCLDRNVYFRNAPWMANVLMSNTAATNVWIADKLNMGAL